MYRPQIAPLIASLTVALMGFFFQACQKEVNRDETNTHLKVELLQSSSIPTLEEITPYEEALVVNEYRVVEVISGLVPQSNTIRIAHWAMTNKQTLPVSTEKDASKTLWITPFDTMVNLSTVYQRDDLAFDPNAALYYDLTPIPEAFTPSENVRHNYRGDISRRLRTYWMIRHQLKLAAIGNSHTAAAVAPKQFYQPGNNKVPVALNLSPAGSGIALQSLLIEQYLAEAPNLEWVIWGVSPRIFNNHYGTDIRFQNFLQSPGYLYDRQHWEELIKLPAPSTPVTYSDIRTEFNTKIHPWGWSKRSEHNLSTPLSTDDRKKFLHQNRRTHFRWSPDAWNQFEKSLKNLTERNINVLLFTPPSHPLITQTATTDIDGTGKRDYEQLVKRLQGLSTKFPNIYFLDISKGGQHNFKHEHFSDFDHLHESGAQILTKELVDYIEKIDKSAAP